MNRILLTLTASGLLGWSASAQSFSNPTPISIPDSGAASPYPSSIAVSGLAGPIISLTVDIFGYSHTFSDDVGMVLVGPTGAALLLFDGAGGPEGVFDVSFTLSDSASDYIPYGVFSSGTYKPTAYYVGDSFPAPGPGTNYNHPGPAGGNNATLASTWAGTNGNGTWNLFVFDFVGGDEGEIAGGWAIHFNTVAEPSTLLGAAAGLAVLARRRRKR